MAPAFFIGFTALFIVDLIGSSGNSVVRGLIKG